MKMLNVKIIIDTDCHIIQNVPTHYLICVIVQLLLGIPGGGKPGMPYGFVRIFLFILFFFYSSAAKVSG